MFRSEEAEDEAVRFQCKGKGVRRPPHLEPPAMESLASAYRRLSRILRQLFARTPARCGLQDGPYAILKRVAGKAASNDARAVFCHGYKPRSHSPTFVSTPK